MQSETRTIAGEPIEFANSSGRWTFQGCRTAGGYQTVEDAEVEVRLQLNNKYSGSLNTAPVAVADQRASVKILKVLWARW
jgi:hypothetical protein